MRRLVGDERSHLAVQSREAHHGIRGKVRLHLEERLTVGDQAYGLSDVVRDLGCVRNEAVEQLVVRFEVRVGFEGRGILSVVRR